MLKQLEKKEDLVFGTGCREEYSDTESHNSDIQEEKMKKKDFTNSPQLQPLIECPEIGNIRPQFEDVFREFRYLIDSYPRDYYGKDLG